MSEGLQSENESLRKQVLELSAQVEVLREVLAQSQSGLLWFMDTYPESVSEVDHEHQQNIDEALLIQPSIALQSYVNEEVAKELTVAASGIESIDDGDKPAYRHCQEYLQGLAADRRGKSGQCECGGVITESKNSGYWICSQCGFDRTGTPD